MICANPKCRNEFDATIKRKKYCSIKCCNSHHIKLTRSKIKLNKPIAKCDECGKEYDKLGMQRFCSIVCRAIYMRKQRDIHLARKQRINGRRCKSCPSYGRAGDCLAVLSGPNAGKPAVAVRLLDQCPRAHGLRDFLDCKKNFIKPLAKVKAVP